MRRLERQHHQPEDPGTWMPLVWSLVVVVSAVTLATLALPSLPEYVQGRVTPRSVFHPEWLVLATLLVVPVYRGSQISWRSALIVVPISCIYALYVADTAVDTLQTVGFTSGWYSAWYAVACAQVALFLGAGAVGAWRDITRRRWVRMMRQVTALPAPPRVGPRNPSDSTGEGGVGWPRRPEDGRAAS
jgi:hypothetical protein